MFAYFYGNMIAVVANRTSDDIIYRLYYVYAEGDGDIGLLKTAAENELVENVSVCIWEHVGAASLQVSASVVGKMPMGEILKGSCDFSDDHAKEIVMPTSISAKIGDKYMLAGTEYTVIGQSSASEFYIPMGTYIDNGYSLSYWISVYTYERQDVSDDPVYGMLCELFPGGRITSGSALSDHADKTDSVIELVLISVCYAVALISYIFLLRYMIDSIMNETIVSMVVGASKLTVAVMVFWETVTLTMASGILGVMLHRLLYPVFFSKINMQDNEIIYTGGDYAFIILSQFVVTLLVLIPFAHKYTKLSPIESRRACG